MTALALEGKGKGKGKGKKGKRKKVTKGKDYSKRLPCKWWPLGKCFKQLIQRR